MQHNGIEPAREDDAIVAAACVHPEAFAPLYEKYSVPVYRWFYRETGHADVAADLTAQVFVQALQHLHRYQPQRQASFRSWLYAIARNLLRDQWRRYRPFVSPPEMIDSSPGPEEIAVHRSEMDALRAALDLLPERQREIVELRLSGLSMREIAEIQGTSEDAVKTAQSRAFKTLRTHLREGVTP
ncbi:MAG: sigma-70 family RNA polymerase sigma factor [Thermomicrobiales bacterium]|nr:sigma-70 family RNA polymerase sigma factor [Thermomicrobiales bacterium]